MQGHLWQRTISVRVCSLLISVSLGLCGAQTDLMMVHIIEHDAAFFQTGNLPVRLLGEGCLVTAPSAMKKCGN